MNTIHIYKYIDFGALVKGNVNIIHVDRISPYGRLYAMKNMSLGERIRMRRKEHGLTAEKLAQRVGVDRTYVSKIERHNFLPSLEVFKSIDKILNLGPDFGKQYIQDKYPDFGDVLKAAIAEDKAKRPKLYFAKGQEKLVKYLKENSPATYADLTTPAGLININELLKELSGCADTHPIAVKFVKRYYPSYVDNKAFINKIGDRLKKLKKKIENSWEDIQGDLQDLTPNPA